MKTPDPEIKKVRRLLSKVNIVVIRYSCNIKLSTPCKNCIKFMMYLGIKKIYYSDEDGNIIYRKLIDIPPTHISNAVRKLYKL